MTLSLEVASIHCCFSALAAKGPYAVYVVCSSSYMHELQMLTHFHGAQRERRSIPEKWVGTASRSIAIFLDFCLRSLALPACESIASHEPPNNVRGLRLECLSETVSVILCFTL